MGIVSWKDEYSVGIQRFDDDHRLLFHLINLVHDGMKAGAGHEVAGPVLEQLDRYTREHFGREEAELRRTAYPGLADHVAQHRAFQRRVAELRAAHAEGRLSVPGDLGRTLKDWLVQHISSSDQAYAPHLAIFGVR